MAVAPACTVSLATVADAEALAWQVGDLLEEIMRVSGQAAFHFDPAETTRRLGDFLSTRKYTVFVARDADGRIIGFLNASESHALYAGGSFGTVTEFYVVPDCRSQGVGRELLNAVRAHAGQRHWVRLELTTPPLPEFDRALDFYLREGFSITGGRKLKLQL